jgi:hypothetical protein
VQGRDGANARRAVTLGMGYLPFGSCREGASRQSSPVAGGVMGEWVRENALAKAKAGEVTEGIMDGW